MAENLRSYTMYNLLGFLVSNGAGFIGGVIVARNLGASGVGALASAFMLVELTRPFGVLSVMPAIRRYCAGADRDAVFGTSLTLHLAAMVPTVLFLVVFSGPLATTLRTFPVVVMLVATILLAFIPSSVGIAYLDANRQFLKRNLIMVASNISYVVFLLVLLPKFHVIETVVVASLLSSLLPAILCIRYLSRPSYDRALARYMFSVGVRMLAVTFLNQAVLWLGVGFASANLGASDAGLYRVSIFLAYMIFQLPQEVVSIWLFPVASEQFTKGRDVRALLLRSTAISVLLALAMLAGLVGAGRVVLGFYGPAFLHAYGIAVLLGVGFFIYSISIPSVNILYTAERSTRVLHITLVRTLIFLLAPILLFKTMSLSVIGAGVIVSSIVGTALFIFYGIKASGEGILRGPPEGVPILETGPAGP